MTPQTIEIEDQSASTKQLSVITITIVVLSLVPPISTQKALVTINKYGTKIKLGQESNPVATPQMQGEAQTKVRQDENYEEVKVKTTLEEQLAIHTLLTL